MQPREKSVKTAYMGNYYGPNDPGEIGPKVHWLPLRAAGKSGAEREARMVAVANGWRMVQVTTREWYDHADGGLGVR